MGKGESVAYTCAETDLLVRVEQCPTRMRVMIEDGYLPNTIVFRDSFLFEISVLPSLTSSSMFSIKIDLDRPLILGPVWVAFVLNVRVAPHSVVR